MSNPVKSNRIAYAPLDIPDRFVEPEKAIVPITALPAQNPLYWAVKTANLDFEEEPLCAVDAAYADRPNQYPSPEA